MTETQSVPSVQPQTNRVLDVEAEANLCEACYQLIVGFGIENVLCGMGRAARLRASDYQQTSRWQYLYHQRIGARIKTSYLDLSEDLEQIEQILAEENPPRHV
jgi:hypothetical protein